MRLQNWIEAFPITESRIADIKKSIYFPQRVKGDNEIQSKICCILAGVGLDEEYTAKTILRLYSLKPKNFELETWLIILSKNRFRKTNKSIRKFTIRYFARAIYLLDWIEDNDYSLELKESE